MSDEQSSTQAEQTPRTKAELVARIERGRAELEQLIAPLTEAELVAPGPDGGWSIKDHLAHLAAWERGIAALLRRQPRWEAMGLDRETVLATDEDGVNALLDQQNRDRSLSEVLAALRQAQKEMSGALDSLEDADLFKPYSFYESGEESDESEAEDGPPVIGWIIGNTYDHYDEHRGYIEAILAGRAG